MHATTTQICTVIGATGVVLSMLIFALSLGAVIVHDGNTAEVTAAMQVVENTFPYLAAGAAALGGIVGATSTATAWAAARTPASNATSSVSEAQ